MPSRSLWRHCNVLLRRGEWNAKIWNFTPLYFLPYHLSKVMAAMTHGNVKARWNTGIWEQEWYWRWTLAMKWRCHLWPHRKFWFWPLKVQLKNIVKMTFPFQWNGRKIAIRCENQIYIYIISETRISREGLRCSDSHECTCIKNRVRPLILDVWC